MLYIDFPLFLASTFSISSFYLVSQKELYPRRWYPHLPLSALPHGARHRPHHHQHHRRHGSPLRHPQPPSRALPNTASRSAANDRKAPRNIASASASSPSSNSSSAATSSSASGTPSPMRTTSPSPSCCSSSSAISIPACSRSSRDASSAGVPALTSTTPPPSPSLWASEPTQNYKAPKTRKARGPGQVHPTARSLDSFHPLSLLLVQRFKPKYRAESQYETPLPDPSDSGMALTESREPQPRPAASSSSGPPCTPAHSTQEPAQDKPDPPAKAPGPAFPQPGCRTRAPAPR